MAPLPMPELRTVVSVSLGIRRRQRRHRPAPMGTAHEPGDRRRRRHRHRRGGGPVRGRPDRWRTRCGRRSCPARRWIAARATTCRSRRGSRCSAGGVDLSPWVTPAAGRRMSPPSKLGGGGGAHGARGRGLAGRRTAPRTAVVMSIAFGAVQATERLLRTVFEQGPESASPFASPRAWPTRRRRRSRSRMQAQGPNLTIVQREAGALTAVGRGAAEVAAGRADRALVGGVEEMPPLLHALLDRFDALARPDGRGGEVARPFDRRRSGFVAAEGAVVLVLERRGARARAWRDRCAPRIRGFGGAFDSSAPRVGWGKRPPAPRPRPRAHCSTRAGVEPARDRPHRLRRLGIDRRRPARSADAAPGLERARSSPPILAPKRVTGEYGGGFLAAALLAAATGDFGATAGFEVEPDPELAVTPHRGGTAAAGRAHAGDQPGLGRRGVVAAAGADSDAARGRDPRVRGRALRGVGGRAHPGA